MRRDFWINQGLFQLAWPACVVGAAHGLAGWTGTLIVGALTLWQLHPARRHPTDFRMIAVCLGLGLVLDTLWVRLGLLAFAQPWPSDGFAPFWIMLLWLALSLVLNHSLSVFKRHLVLVGVLGGVGSPLSYFAGSQLGGVEWVAPAWQVVLATGLSWALVLPFLFWLAEYGQRDGRYSADSESLFRSVT